MPQLDRQCEKFMGGPTPAFSERLHVTINRIGTIYLNQKAYKLMGSPMAVYLYYNRPKDMIVLEPTQAITSTAAFMLRDSRFATGRYIYANPFCKNFNIRPDTTLRFISPETDAVRRLYLKLGETVGVPRPGRRGPGKSQNRLR